MVRFRNQKSQSTTVLFWTTFTRTMILNLFIPTLGWETLATNRFEKSGCRTSTRNDRSTKKGDLTQVLLSHALSAVISVRQTFGCVLSFGVTDVAHDGLLWNWFNESCLHWELFTFKQAIVWWSNRQIIALFRMPKCAIANFQCQSNLNHISYTLPQTDTLHSAWAGFCLMLSIAFLCYSVQCTWLTRLIKNWFMPSVRISSYGCTWEVWRAWERRTCTSCNRGASLASWVLLKLSKCIHNSIYSQIRAWTYSFTPYILANKNAFFINCKILVPRRTEK